LVFLNWENTTFDVPDSVRTAVPGQA